MPYLPNMGKEFKMDQFSKLAIHFNDLRFYSTSISMRDKGGILFRAIADLKRYLGKSGSWKCKMISHGRCLMMDMQGTLYSHS